MSDPSILHRESLSLRQEGFIRNDDVCLLIMIISISTFVLYTSRPSSTPPSKTIPDLTHERRSPLNRYCEFDRASLLKVSTRIRVCSLRRWKVAENLNGPFRSRSPTSFILLPTLTSRIDASPYIRDVVVVTSRLKEISMHRKWVQDGQRSERSVRERRLLSEFFYMCIRVGAHSRGGSWLVSSSHRPCA
ncbi:hypothetical protein EV361DRAFT_405667 [Lentinula raphanica]|uniref:Uncharacterized protein n=1 Tax=Lentinula raphanica TaxID=153919 RepID=A0AA38NZ62_9AGAR|nr:hypothetical protein F5880DRAFT_1168848 [Lentinula raphanica]KAJ3833291.1 hypothetical protein F5878DRAFT_413320 [Lentinula raphanica]KAJ3968647.1 hypothetical protein EV361DRAFT_405667 [Lentinula raphanica]